MESPETKSEAAMQHKRKYRLNKKKFVAVVISLCCLAVVIVLITEALAGAYTDVQAMEIPGIPERTEDSPEQTVEQAVKILEGRLIVIDAGHGGFDPGAIGVDGTYESELNLEIAKSLKTELESYGAQIIMTRSDGNALADSKQTDMAERRRIIEESGSDIVISIHMNSHEDSSISGPLVLFMPNSENGKKLADTVQESLNDELAAEGMARSDNLYILRSGNQPCILIECGYISNASEESMLKRQDYQLKVVKSICEGIEKYFAE